MQDDDMKRNSGIIYIQCQWTNFTENASVLILHLLRGSNLVADRAGFLAEPNQFLFWVIHPK